MTEALIVVDMHEAPLSDPTKHDVPGVVARINRLAGRVRGRGGVVVFVLHEGEAAHGQAVGSPGWEIFHGLERDPEDRRVRKRGNDAFSNTSLASDLREFGADRVIVTGWATDFCVDATVRAAVEHGFAVRVASDCHTLNDRPHLAAPQVIEHHNWVWANLIADPPVSVLPEAEL